LTVDYRLLFVTVLVLVSEVAPVAGQVPPLRVAMQRSARVAPGTIAGRVIAADTRSAIAGVEVAAMGVDAQVLTGEDGRFRMISMPAGSYTLRFTHLGYRARAQADVIVRPDRITFVEVELEPAALELPGIATPATFFRRGVDGGASRVGFSGEEIRRAPGSAGDVSRILMSLPALTKVNDQSNALIVRGGSPLENAFFVDDIEIPNINHFPTQGASGGPIGILNVDLIEEVTLHAGAFPSTYGDRLSSVMDIRLRAGNRSEVDGQLALDFAGFGAVAEGPLPGARGSWVLSGRRSYLDLLVKAIDVGTTVAPRFGSYQGKATLELGQGQDISVLAVVSDDHNDTDLETAIENAMLQFGRQDIVQGTAGLRWSAVWNDRVWSRTSVSFTGSRFIEDLFETATGGGALLTNRSTEREMRVRNVNRVRLSERSSLDVGIEVKRTDADYDNAHASRVGPLGDTLPALRVDADVGANKLAAFASWTMSASPRLTATLGMRADHFTYNGATHVTPRASVTYRLDAATALTAEAGLYRQSLPMVLLAQNEMHGELRDPAATHFVASVERFLSEDTRLTVEAYRKDYRNLPLDPNAPALFPLDELFYDFGFFTGHEQLTDDGRASATGIELVLQKKLAADFYGLASAAYARSRYRGGDRVWRDRVFDNRWLMGLEGGYKPGSTWELSARWIYAGGPPYTPLDLQASALHNRAILDGSRINAVRYPDYHSLNLRADRRFHFTRSNLVAYVSVWNAYNRDNVASYYWNAVDRQQGVIRQWGILPVFGFEFEF
jgi:hypothetical protein